MYGQTIAKDLLSVSVPQSKDSQDDESSMTSEEVEKWSAEIHFTSPNYQAKKMVFLLFINRTCAYKLVNHIITAIILQTVLLSHYG